MRLVGVYDAKGGVRGELSYILRSRLGGQHCALCDITHGVLHERVAWRRCRSALPVPFDLFHRRDQPVALRLVAGDRAPVVAAETDAGFVLLTDPSDIAACSGDPERLVDAVERATHRLGLQWPGKSDGPATGRP